MNTIRGDSSRDPVCEAIEALLRNLEAEGKGEFRTINGPESVRVRFAEMEADGESRDIALVRLANVMMGDTRYSALIMETLREPMRKAS